MAAKNALASFLRVSKEADESRRREGQGAREPREWPFPESLCHACAEHRYVEGKATVFILCTALAVKYPPQPVTFCAAFRRATS